MRKRFLALLTGALVLVLSAGVGLSVAGTTASGSRSRHASAGRTISRTRWARSRRRSGRWRSEGREGRDPAGHQGRQGRQGPVRELAREGEDSILTVLGEFGNRHQSDLRRHARPAAQPDPGSPIGRSTTRRSGRPTSARPTTRTCCSTTPRARTRCGTSTRSSRRTATRSTARSTDWVQSPVQRGPLRQRTTAAASSAPTRLALRQRLGQRLVRRPDRGRAAAAEINAYLAKFDVWDRYDYDGDGNFNEPDGYIDHFQSVHAGEGEETGGGAQGTDAIWCHRWYAFYNHDRA